jgi:hypothetical protein
MPTIRMLPPIAIADQTITRPGNGGLGRTLSATPGGYLDVSDGDAVILEANGWARVGLVGPTANRPPLTGLAPAFCANLGMKYIDITISAVIVFDGATWRNPLTGGAV